VEPDSQGPDFLHNSRLGIERAGEVVFVMRDACVRFKVGLNDGDQAVKEAQASPGGVGGLTEVGVQATEGEQGMNVDIIEEMGTGEIITELVVLGVEGPKQVSGEGEGEVSEERKQGEWKKKKGSAPRKQPAPSSSNFSIRSMIHKQNDSPTRNTRSSKRVTKPSRRRCGSDYA